jgi:hydrogenase maturation protein HypF
LAQINTDELALLTSRTRPIVLVAKRQAAPLAASVAPNLSEIGLLLPYTPLHELLLEDSPPLVMTSGNLSGEPILTTNENARAHLSTLAEALLLHDRDIHVPCDDSVLRVWQGVEFPLRRSRGYAPFPIKLPFALPPLLAVGGELKNTFCLVRDEYAFLSQHIGDVESAATLHALTQSAAQFEAIFRTTPQAIVIDAHPRYQSAAWGRNLATERGLPCFTVQHHHAHIAAVMAEHRLSGAKPVIGVCLDGTGYGDDGAIWGGEVLLADYRHFERRIQLDYMPLVGGDSAVKHPCRLALAYLWAAGMAWSADLAPVAATSPIEQRVIRQQLATGFNTVPTSSMGRLFDAVSALIGVCQHASYEAQAALELEAQVDSTVTTAYLLPLTSPPTPLSVYREGAKPTISSQHWHIAPLLQAIVADLRAGVPRGVIAAKFHNAIAQGILAAVQQVARVMDIRQVALSGGVFQNVVLFEATVQLLEAHAFTVYGHQRVPANDGGLALGQAIIGGMRLRGG